MSILEYDNTFLLKLKNWDNETFNKFYIETVDFFFRWIKSVYFLEDDDIEDILSDFYFKIWNNRDWIPTDRIGFKRWIWFVLKNILKDFFKSKKLYNFSELKLNNLEDDKLQIEDIIEDTENLFEEIDKNYKLELIKDAIHKLPDIYRQVLILKYVDNLSNDEIAEFLWITNDVVRQRISRGLKKLKLILDNKKL